MGLIYTKTYGSNPPKIVDLQVDYPLAIVTDTHTNIRNVAEIRRRYPNVVCLGDITNLYSKKESFNGKSIDFFIKAGIPCLKGNHEEHISECSDDNYVHKVLPRFDEHSSLFDVYGLTQQQTDFIKNLPIGFRLNFPDGTHYLAFHNRPKDLWSFFEKPPMKDEFLKIYPVNEKTRGVIIGHHHRVYTQHYVHLDCQLYFVGRLLKEGNFAVIEKTGLVHSNVSNL